MPKIIFSVVLLSNLLFAGQKVLISDNIHIYYSEKCKQISAFTMSTALKQLPQLKEVFGNAVEPINIYITNSQKEFEKIAGSHLPYWTAAVTVFPKKIIVLKSPGQINTTLRQFRETVEHEFIHLYQGMFIPLNITPAWFNEGLAQFFSSPYDIRSRITLSRAIFNNQIIPLDKLTEFLKYNHLQAELAYSESASLVEYLVVVYGVPIIHEIFEDLGRTKNFSVTLQRLTDVEIETLESRWIKYITHRYRWIFLLDIQYIIWLIILLLVIIAFFTKNRRNKTILQQWNIDENAENEILTE